MFLTSPASFPDRSAAIEDTSLDVRHVLAEFVLPFTKLERRVAGVPHNQARALSSDRLNPLDRGQDGGRCLQTGKVVVDTVPHLSRYPGKSCREELQPL